MRFARTFVFLAALGILVAPQDTKYTVVGTPTELGLAGYANILCGAVFITGRDPNEAAHNSAYWMMPRGQQDTVIWDVDRNEKAVRASLDGITREATFFGDQGCIIQPPHAQGNSGIHFTPVAVRTTLPGAMSQPWPMGDRPDATPIPTEIDHAKLDAAVTAAFADPDALTAALVVVYKGHIIAESYGTGATKDTQLESWSMGKSIVSTLFSLLSVAGSSGWTLNRNARIVLALTQASRNPTSRPKPTRRAVSASTIAPS